MVISKAIVSIARTYIFGGLCLVVLFAAPSVTSAAELVAQTKLRISIVQWMPTQGRYEKWDALGGDFEVGKDGTILLPIIGTVSVGGLGPQELADEISKRIKSKIGLMVSPNTTVQVIDFPPIYVVGDVKEPGQYRFRDGLTVLQALALGGGEYRNATTENTSEVISLVSELRSTDAGILRSMARVARLQAEASGAEKIKFPSLPLENSEKERASDIFNQERVIFIARRNGLDRQTKSLEDLRNLLSSEIDTLQQKIAMTDDLIKTTENELHGVKVLVEKGISVASRQSDLERQLASYRADRLDNLTAVMRARQSISEATRNLEGLQDQRETEIVSELQQEQSNIDSLRRKRDTTQKLLIDRLSATPGSIGTEAGRTLDFTIIRRVDGKPTEIAATESSELMPGDVLKVTGGAHPAGSQATPDEALQPENSSGDGALPELSSSKGQGM